MLHSLTSPTLEEEGKEAVAANEQCRHKHHQPEAQSMRAQCDIPDQVGLLLIKAKAQ